MSAKLESQSLIDNVANSEEEAVEIRELERPKRQLTFRALAVGISIGVCTLYF